MKGAIARITAALCVPLSQFHVVTSLALSASVATRYQGENASITRVLKRKKYSNNDNSFNVALVDKVKLSSGGRSRGSTQVQASLIAPLSTSVGAISPAIRNVILLGAVALAIAKRKQILYPGTSADPNYSEPLPPGSFGCPFFGVNMFQTTNKSGPGEFYRRARAKLGNARIFKFMFLGRPVISVAGLKNIKQVFSTEFKSIQIFGSPAGTSSLFGPTSLNNCRDNKEHIFQRHLVGAAMTLDSVNSAAPLLQKAATDQIDKILELPTAVMDDVCTNFTLDVAWRQIIGLNLKEAEIPLFRQAVKDWTSCFTDLRVMFLPGAQFTKAGRAHSFLVSLIEKRIDELNRSGPDGSTLSSMVFAKDDLDGKRLSRQQVIDNTLLLMFAGSETTSSTLTTGILLLGLHYDVFQKVKEEQRALASLDGGVLSLRQLDKECPYLDAVVKEIMRINPLAIGSPVRSVEETLVVDGKQIPKGYGVSFNIESTHAYDPVVSVPDGSHMDVVRGFKPERWLSEATRPSEFLPFGYGPRYCLGSNLAIAEMKVFFALFARRVDFKLVNMSKDHVTWQKMSIIRKPEDGCVIAALPSTWKQRESRYKVEDSA